MSTRSYERHAMMLPHALHMRGTGDREWLRGGIAMPRQFSLTDSHPHEGHSISAQFFPSRSGEKQHFTPLFGYLATKYALISKSFLPSLLYAILEALSAGIRRIGLL